MRTKIIVLLFFLSACAYATSPVYRVMLGGGTGGGNPITVNSDWGETDCSSSTHCDVTSPTRTLTVPIGNSGTLKLNITANGGPTFQYSKNGGAFTTFSNGTAITVASNDTLAFKLLTVPAATGSIATIVDNDSGNTVGTVSLQNIHS